jgi:superfamily II DNA or RNA helicase
MTVPRLSLVDQTIEKLAAEGVINVGVIQADHFLTNRDALIQLASVQTLARRLIPDASEILIDEAHVWFEYYLKLFEAPAFAEIPIIGFTATPWTKGLGKHYKKLITGGTTQELIEGGYLSDFKVWAPPPLDLSGISIDHKSKDYQIAELARRMGKVELVADCVDTWLARANGRPTILFAVNCAHAQQLRDKFIERGVAAEYIDAFTPRPERIAIGRRLHSRETKVVCSVETLTIGVDWDVRCLILARPTKSEILYVQMVGRGLRTAPGKDYCLILDHSDNSRRLGFVTDVHHDHLDCVDKELRDSVSREALPKECAHCGYLKPPKVRKCPHCGFEPVAQSNAFHAQGELVELKSRNEEVRKFVDPVLFYRELKWIAQERSRQPGWVAHSYKAKFGNFPPYRWKDAQPAIEPSLETRNWIRSRDIAYAKSRKAA